MNKLNCGTEACNNHQEEPLVEDKGGDSGVDDHVNPDSRKGDEESHPPVEDQENSGQDSSSGQPGNGNFNNYFSSGSRSGYNRRIRRVRSPNGPPNDAYYNSPFAEMRMQGNYMRYNDNPMQYPQSPIENVYVPPLASAYPNHPDVYSDYGSQPSLQGHPPIQSYSSRETGGEDTYRQLEPIPYNGEIMNGEQRPMNNYGDNSVYSQPNVFSDPQVPEVRRSFQNVEMDPYAAHQAEIARLTKLNEERMRRYEEEKAKYYNEHLK
ncbi:unnamed protein product [Hymenolepis diminuta]|uniref:Uncharacterized protein n=1 Tax=Hymenolepis diminuta TaxID=6216 RepID=A0A0R3SVZ2_HYMDI|nr:unnamed protein product [Hymenolepis diminuta]